VGDAAEKGVLRREPAVPRCVRESAAHFWGHKARWTKSGAEEGRQAAEALTALRASLRDSTRSQSPPLTRTAPTPSSTAPTMPTASEPATIIYSSEPARLPQPSIDCVRTVALTLAARTCAVPQRPSSRCRRPK